MPLLLRLYLGLAALAGPGWWLALRRRLRRGREDPARWRERLGVSALPRPAGRILWFHAASVGESQALVTLITRLLADHPGLGIVLTSQTRASAEALAGRGLPRGVIHLYAPVDTPGAVARFLAHWRPEALVVTEIDLWPAMLTRARAAGLGMMLLNTRLDPARTRRRQRIAAVNAWLFNLFDRVLVQDDASRDACVALGVDPGRLSVMGALKAASEPLPDQPALRADLAGRLGTRPRWLAASTWPDEDPALFEAQHLAAAALPGLVMLIAPRQRDLADQTEAAARARFAPDAIARRSRGDSIGAATQVYIADTIGEMGLWYRLAPVTFVGKSLPGPGGAGGGHNPFEAAALGSLVLHGPRVDSCAEAYAALQAEGGALMVTDAETLAARIRDAQDPAFCHPRTEGAARVLATSAAPLAVALTAVKAMLARRAA